jgi:hypothetical protein
MALQHLRSSTASKRPDPAAMVDGQLAVNTNAASTGLFFKDSGGNLIKVGPVHVGITAPNATPAAGGQAGNSIGEQWLDTTGGGYVLKIWDGSAWQSEAGEFVNASGDTMTGALVMDNQQQVRFRETTANGTNFVALQAPASVASDKTITLPDVTGTVVTTGDTGSVTSTMLLDGTILNADINASAAIAGTKISPDFGSQNVTTTGTATAASLNPTGSTVPANGVYLPAANTVGVATNSTGRLFINSSGQVGLGTSSADNKLSVGIASADEGIELKATYNGFRIARFGLVNPGVDNTPYIGSLLGSDFGFITNSTRRMTLTADGKLGIGVTGPTATFDCNGSIRAISAVPTIPSSGTGLEIYYASATFTGTPSAYLLSYDRTASSYKPINIDASEQVFRTGGTERTRIDSSGRLLVGTSTSVQSDAKIQIQNGYLSLYDNADSSNAGYGILFHTNGGATGRRTAQIESLQESAGTSGGRLVFSTTADGAASPTERMRIGQTGYLKASNTGTYISTAGVYHELVADGADYVLQARNSNAAPYGIYVNYSGAAPNGTSNEFYVAADTGGTRFTVRSNGGITNYSANNINLSDRNVKKDITPASGTWDCIKEWEIVNFRYKDQPEDTDLNMGVIAQQVAESCPEVITVFQEAKESTETEPAQEERLGVKDQQMIWMAIKALQEAQLRIETLEAEVAALKAS